MKALLLGAGFGTRLERDLKSADGELYAHLIGVPKPLLPIGKHPLATHWMHTLAETKVVDDVCIVTNGINHFAFVEWSKKWSQVKLVSDGAISNETRTGAVACINLGAQHFNLQDDLLVIAGDTLFYEDFNLKDIVNRFNRFKEMDREANMVLYVTCTDAEVHKYGILETDEHERVTGFLEKPQPTETTSRKECPCFYFLNQSSLPLLEQFLTETKDLEMKARDATGNFIRYLYQRKPVYATEISGRFDVGGLQSYITCHEHFLKQSS